MRAVRSLLKTPSFTIVGLLTLALGIGVNTSMFSLVRTLLFDNGPYPNADRIVRVTALAPHGEQGTFSAIEHGEIRAHTTAFAALTMLSPTYPAFAEIGRPTARVAGVMASSDLFATLGVQPMLGRPFTAEETQRNRNNVILISHRCWKTRYAGAADVVGRKLRIDGDPVEIIGVMPPSFDYPLLWQNAEFWRPLGLTREQAEVRQRRAFQLLGRLAPGLNPAQANAELAPLAKKQERDHPETYHHFRYRVRSLHETMADQTGRNTSWMLLALSGFVLLIGCANLANLQLARAAGGVRELAIRSALGASRRSLILHQLQESVVLALAGGALGVAVSYALNAVVSRQFKLGPTAGLALEIDGVVLTVAFLVALLSGALFGLAPAWLASNSNLNAALKSQARGSTTGRGHRLLRYALIIAEVALVFVLLSGAGMMQRGFARFLEHDNGWDTEHVLTAAVGLSETRFEDLADRDAYYRRLQARLAIMPGVEKAALATSLPVQGYNAARPFFTERQSIADSARLPLAFQVLTTPDFFAAMGIPLRAGTTFAPELSPGAPSVAIVNESIAQLLWPNESAIGRRIATDEGGTPVWHEVIGVARDVTDAAALRPPETPYTIYRPLHQQPWPWAYLVVRSRAPAALADPLRRAVMELDADIPADLVATVPDLIEGSQEDLRLAGKGLIAFAALGLVMAAVGIYGVISGFVAQRATEFGIRLALGAQPRDIQTLVLRDGVTLTAIGLALGLAGAVVLARALAAWLPRIVTLDWLTLAAVTVFLLLVAIAACLVPARRATKVDPLVALRED